MNHLFKNIEISFIGILSSLILAYSVIYEYGFIRVLDIGFAELPTTLSDHIRSSLIWIIPTCSALIFGYFYNKIIHQPEFDYMDEEEYVESSKNKIFAWMNYHKYAIIFLIALIIIAVRQGLEPLLRMWGLLIIFFITWTITPISKYLAKNTKLSKIEFILLITFIPFGLLIYNIGQLKAYAIKDDKSPEFLFQFEDNSTCKGTLARSYEKVYMIWDKQTQKVKFIKADKIISFTPIDINQTNGTINKMILLNENNATKQIEDKNIAIEK